MEEAECMHTYLLSEYVDELEDVLFFVGDVGSDLFSFAAEELGFYSYAVGHLQPSLYVR